MRLLEEAQEQISRCLFSQLFFRPNKVPLYLHHVVLCYLRKHTSKSKGPFKSLGALHIIKTIRSECQVGCLEKIKKILRAVSLI